MTYLKQNVNSINRFFYCKQFQTWNAIITQSLKNIFKLYNFHWKSSVSHNLTSEWWIDCAAQSEILDRSRGRLPERKSPLPFGYRLQPLSGQFPRWRKTSEESGITVNKNRRWGFVCWGGVVGSTIWYAIVIVCCRPFCNFYFVKAITARSWNGALGAFTISRAFLCVTSNMWHVI